MSQIFKGMTVLYYPTGDTAYSDAAPAIVLDHDMSGMVLMLKVLRAGQDYSKRDVKHRSHPSFMQFPHHAAEQGVWDHLVTAKSAVTPPTNGYGIENSPLADRIRDLATRGMSPSAIVGKLKDNKVTLEMVTSILGAPA